MNRLARESPSPAAALPLGRIERRDVGIAFARGVALKVPVDDESVRRWVVGEALDRHCVELLVNDLDDDFAGALADRCGPADETYVAAFARARAAIRFGLR